MFLLFSHAIAWEKLEEDMASHYGRVSLPRHPISEMAALLMLTHRYNLSEEHVVAMCQEKAYYQYFAGEASFQRGHPCSACDLVYCRHRLGAGGIEKLSALSMALHAAKVNKAKRSL